MAEAGIEHSVCSVGDNCDEALAETSNGLFEAATIHHSRPWRSLKVVEYATLEWVDRLNNASLLKLFANIPPAEAEANFYATLEAELMATQLSKTGLRQTQCDSWRAAARLPQVRPCRHLDDVRVLPHVARVIPYPATLRTLQRAYEVLKASEELVKNSEFPFLEARCRKAPVTSHGFPCLNRVPLAHLSYPPDFREMWQVMVKED